MERQETRKLINKYNKLDSAESSEAQEILTKMLGAKGRDCVIEMPFRCDCGSNTRLGDNLYTATHPLEPKIRATGVVVVPGVTIGRGAVIGAGSVVTKNVPPMCVYAGNPAKFIKKIEME
ncbi:Bacterial transferase hexapeptide (six repeats) [Phytophthora infestans]|uniref:Bacterial transferase hexapeptide (Six repeats) n=1 Tax=Phytophthora infestans TaxID=4787 RepID=A0A833STK1_PHYIN|nr:Bacterial transferase hexapeptide (six repeats) [Phytophthora infestans]